MLILIRTLAMRSTYHPATGFRFHAINGSEMFREGLRRLLENPDSQEETLEISYIEEGEDEIAEDSELVEEDKLVRIRAVKNLNVNV